MKAWMRLLSITFTSRLLKKSITFGNNRLQGKDDFNIDVKIYKYMSTLKDSASVKITNLTYGEIIRLIQGQFYDVEIKAGYEDLGQRTIFKGGVLFISNSVNTRKENVIIISCASSLVARFGQRRISINLNSGINTYSALNYVCKRAGIPNSNISTQFKKDFIEDVISANQDAPSFMDSLTKNNTSVIANSDASDGSFLTLFNSKRSNSRIYKIDSNSVILSGGYPQLTKDGLTFDTLPSINYMCGDTVIIDNSLINIGSEIGSNPSPEAMSKGYYLDKEGKYMIYQMEYSLQNRGSNFSVKLYGKARGLISNYIGGLNG